MATIGKVLLFIVVMLEELDESSWANGQPVQL